MDEQTTQLVQAIHAAPYRLVFVAAGAGTEALATLLGVGGASRTLLEALIPYSTQSFDEFLGQSPEKYVTLVIAQQMAGRAQTRAQQLAVEDLPLIGLACTATITTDRPKRGEHRAYIAAWQPERLISYALHLCKGKRNRTEEETVISHLLLNVLAEAMGVEIKLPLALTPEDELTGHLYDFLTMAHRLQAREFDYFGVSADGRLLSSPPQALLSGSFNPLHEGHIQLAETAARLLETAVAFECTAVNADKPPLPSDVLLQRLAQFAGRWPIFASTAPTFVEKARCYPGTTFIVGYDTAVRLLQPRFYQNDLPQMYTALSEIRTRGCSFLVAGRIGSDGIFHDMNDLSLPPGFSDLFQAIPATEFRLDISSTERRAGK